MASRSAAWVDFDTRGEFHGPEEIILDWKQNVMLRWPKETLVTLPMRTHVLLQKDKNGKEKIRRIEEEWWGNALLGPGNTLEPLGRIHQHLRIFTGKAVAAAAKARYI